LGPYFVLPQKNIEGNMTPKVVFVLSDFQGSFKAAFSKGDRLCFWFQKLKIDKSFKILSNKLRIPLGIQK
jgi:hypothetical protein